MVGTGHPQDTVPQHVHWVAWLHVDFGEGQDVHTMLGTVVGDGVRCSGEAAMPTIDDGHRQCERGRSGSISSRWTGTRMGTALWESAPMWWGM